MNEIIEQLAERADLYADNYLQSKGEYHPDWHTVRDNKFAELIVKECASICEHRYTYMNKDMSEGAFEAMACYDSILEHFGIEDE